MNKIPIKLLFLAICLLWVTISALAQKSSYKTYTNKTHRFSFQIPSTWQVLYSKKQEGLICVPTIPSEKKSYSECLEGIVFRIFIEDPSVYSLMNGVLQKQDGSYYTVTGRFNDTVLVKKTVGKNWDGIDYTSSCGIDCKENGFHGAAGECAFLYFANKKETVLITTNGRDFEPKVRKRLLRSFVFN